MNDLRYFIRWNTNRLRSPTPYSQGIPIEEARDLHDARRVYTAVALRDGRAHAYVESNGGFFGVNFIDAEGRVYLIYSFREREAGRLFLEQATFKRYDGPSPRAARQEMYLFAPDGTHSEKVSDFVRNTSMDSRPRVVDVSGNWSPYPAFGRYEDLLRVER